MENIKRAYSDLFVSANLPQGYRLNKTKVYFNQLSHFVGMKGKKYDQQTIKLLIVGRAVNGWGQLNTASAEDFAMEAIEKMQKDNFNWIVCDKSSLRNDCLDNGEYYWLNDSPFWRTNKRIWMSLTNNHDFQDLEQDKWVDYIAWTNLYKIAPLDTGNPTTTMSKRQLDSCKKILKAEIENFKQTHILFITGYEWWFEDFKEIFDIEFKNVKKNVYHGENKNSFFAETYGTTSEGVKIVVSCRPEFRDENLYVDDIVNSFTKL
jgi:hypothetical protein